MGRATGALRPLPGGLDSRRLGAVCRLFAEPRQPARVDGPGDRPSRSSRARRTSTQGILRLWRKDGPLLARRRGARGRPGSVSAASRRTSARATAPPCRRIRPPDGSSTGWPPNPGVRYAYHRIACGDWWVEDPRSPYYSRFRHAPCGSKPPFRVTSEDLSRSPTAYRHFAVIRYNADPVVPGRGSGIFLHASTGRPRWAASACRCLSSSRFCAGCGPRASH